MSAAPSGGWGGDFNPRTPRGVRLIHVKGDNVSNVISIHAPREGCDVILLLGDNVHIQFQSTHPARGATAGSVSPPFGLCISIHAPREGCDRIGQTSHGSPKISIHAPREGCDHDAKAVKLRRVKFQSTHPARGATARSTFRRDHSVISIHAPREGCDSKLYQRAESLLGSICLFAQGEEG